jgi:hypothetical protein
MPQKADEPVTGQKPLFYRRAIDDLFLQHPAAAGETYLQHLLFTVKTGGHLLLTSIALILHGFVPKFYQTTASDRIIRLNDVMQERRNAFEAGAPK